jgi:hypothetical protein
VLSVNIADEVKLHGSPSFLLLCSWRPSLTEPGQIP